MNWLKNILQSRSNKDSHFFTDEEKQMLKELNGGTPTKELISKLINHKPSTYLENYDKGPLIGAGVGILGSGLAA